jgi:putative chitinase
MVVFPKYFPTIEFAGEYHRQPQKIANLIYANRMGNGDTESNDGWTFHGRSPIQLTGRDNYFQFGKRIGVDLIAKPELLLKPDTGTTCTCSFWQFKGLNELADIGDFRSITKRINGGLNGLDQREEYYEKAKQVLM